MSDWRRHGQEKFLKGAELLWEHYTPPTKEWDHDHCAFCFQKFSAGSNDLHEGYTTKDRRHWICDKCYSDFKDEFRWVVNSGRGS